MALTITATPHITSGTCDYITIAYTGADVGFALVYYRNGSSIKTDTSGPSGSYDDHGISVGTAYTYYVTCNGFTSNSVGITPKACLAPTIGTTHQSGTVLSTSCTKNGSTPDSWKVYRSDNGGSYNYLTSRSAAQTAYDDGGVSHGNTYSYKWGSVISGYPESISGASNSVYMANSFSDTIEATFIVSDGQTDVFYPTDTIANYIILSDEVYDQATFFSTIADTYTMSDHVASSQTLKTDFTYYIGTEVGAIYETSLDYQYDDLATSGTSVQGAIVPTWYSRTIDFVEKNEDNTGKWKCLYRVEYIYRDWGSVPVTIHVSNNGGATWTIKTKTVGTAGGTGKTEHAHFHFQKTGQFFIFKIEWPSATYDFQFLGFDAVYQEMADQWEVSGL